MYCCSNGVLIVEVSLPKTVYCSPSGVLIIEVSLYSTAYCGPSGVLIIEVPLYSTAYCSPSGVLIIEVPLCTCGLCLYLLHMFVCGMATVPEHRGCNTHFDLWCVSFSILPEIGPLQSRG